MHPRSGRGSNALADAGCVVGNQMVLLKGVNEDAEMVREMNRWLLRHRCRPYYIFQCDSVEGASHFKTPTKTGVDLIQKIRGWTSGLAVPHYVVDLPKGGGRSHSVQIILKNTRAIGFALRIMPVRNTTILKGSLSLRPLRPIRPTTL